MAPSFSRTSAIPSSARRTSAASARWRAGVGVIAIVAALSSFVPVPRALAQEAQLQAQENSVAQLVGSLSATQSEVDRLELEMGALREEVNKALVDLQDARTEAEQARQGVQQARAELDATQEEIAVAQAQLDEISRSAYRRTTTAHAVSTLAGEDAAADSLDRQTYLRTNAEKQRETVDRLDRLRTEQANNESQLRLVRNLAQEREEEASRREQVARAAISANSVEIAERVAARDQLLTQRDQAQAQLDQARNVAAAENAARQDQQEFQAADAERKRAEDAAAQAAASNQQAQQEAARANEAQQQAEAAAQEAAAQQAAAEEAARVAAANEADASARAEQIRAEEAARVAQEAAAAAQAQAQEQEAARARAQAEAEAQAQREREAQAFRDAATAAAVAAAAAVIAAAAADHADLDSPYPPVSDENAPAVPLPPVQNPSSPSLDTTSPETPSSGNPSSGNPSSGNSSSADTPAEDSGTSPADSPSSAQLPGLDTFADINSQAEQIISGERSAAIEAVIARAQSQIGVPYAWGGGNASGPTQGIRDGGVADANGDFNKVGFDCSGLTLYAFAAAGIALPHYTGYQYNYGTKISHSEMQRGDLIFYGPGGNNHVAIYLGDGMMIEAPNSGSFVRTVPVRYSGISEYAVRLI